MIHLEKFKNSEYSIQYMIIHKIMPETVKEWQSWHAGTLEQYSPIYYGASLTRRNEIPSLIEQVGTSLDVYKKFASAMLLYAKLCKSRKYHDLSYQMKTFYKMIQLILSTGTFSKISLMKMIEKYCE